MSFDAGHIEARLGYTHDKSGLNAWERAVNQASARSKKKVEQQLGADVDQSGFRAYDRAVARASGKKIDADTSAIDRKLAKIRTELAEIGVLRASPNVDLDTDSFDRRVKILKAEMARLSAMKATIKVDGTQDVDRASNSVKGLVGSIGGSGSIFSAGGAKLLMFGGAAQTVLGDVSALAGGLVSLVSSLAPLSALSVAIPAAASAAGQALGVTALAGTGLTDALGALSTQQTTAGTTASNMADQQQAAAQQVTSAEAAVASAKRASNVAEEDLTAARAAAVRELEDMKTAAVAASDAEKGSALAVREAQRALKDLQNVQPGEKPPSVLELRRAELAVTEAKHQQKAASIDAARADEDLAKRERQGISRSPGVVAAERSKADARRSLQAAIVAERLAEQQAAKAMTQTSAAADTLQAKIDKLPPATQEFAHYLFDLKPQLDKVRETAAAGLFPGVEEGIAAAMHNLPALDRVVGSTAGELGDLATQAGRFVGRDGFGRDFETIAAGNNRLLQAGGDATFHFVDALRNVLVVAQPFLRWMENGIVDFSKYTEEATKSGRETGKLGDWFKSAEEPISRVVSIGKSLIGTLLNIGHAARPFGDDELKALDQGARSLERITGSVQGQKTLADYFADSNAQLHQMGEDIKTILDAGDLGDQIAKAIELALPGVAENAGHLGLALAKGLITGFMDSGVWGKLFTAAAFIRLVGGRGALGAIGGAIGRRLLGGAASSTVGGGLGGMLTTPGATPARPMFVSVVNGGLPGTGTEPVPTKGPLGRALDTIKGGAKTAATVAATRAVPAAGVGAGIFAGLAFGSAGAAALADKYLGAPKGSGAITQAQENVAKLREEVKHLAEAGEKVPANLIVKAGLDPKALQAAGVEIKGFNKLLDDTHDAGVSSGLGVSKMASATVELGSGLKVTKSSVKDADQSVGNFTDQLAKGVDGLKGFSDGADHSFDKTAKGSDRMKDAVSRSVDSLQGAVDSALGLIVGGANKILKALGVDPIKFGAAVSDVGNSVTETAGGKSKHARGGILAFAGGGMFRVPGTGHEDTVGLGVNGTVSAKVAPGEDVLVANRHQRPLLDRAVSAAYGVSGLPGFFSRFDQRHGAAAGYAKGGVVPGDTAGLHPGILNFVTSLYQRFGGSISSGLRPEDSDSLHSTGQAADYVPSDWRGAATAANAAGSSLLEGIYNPAVHGDPAVSWDTGVQQDPSFWGSSTWADHTDHIHLAIADGTKAVAKAVVEKLKKVVLSGPDGPFKALGQAAIDKVRGAADKYIANKAPSAVGTETGSGSVKAAPGGWVKVGATYEGLDGQPGYTGEAVGGMNFAELLVAGENAGLRDQDLAATLGLPNGPSGMPAGTPIQVRKPGAGTAYTITKNDIGSGQAGDPYYKVDLQTAIANKLAGTTTQDIEVHKAARGGLLSWLPGFAKGGGRGLHGVTGHGGPGGTSVRAGNTEADRAYAIAAGIDPGMLMGGKRISDAAALAGKGGTGNWEKYIEAAFRLGLYTQRQAREARRQAQAGAVPLRADGKDSKGGGNFDGKFGSSAGSGSGDPGKSFPPAIFGPANPLPGSDAAAAAQAIQDEIDSKWVRGIAFIDEKISNFNQLFGTSWSEAGTDLSDSERSQLVALNENLLAELSVEADVARRGIDISKRGLKNATGKTKTKLTGLLGGFQTTLDGLVGVSGGSGRIFDTNFELARLNHPDEVATSPNLEAINALLLQQNTELLRDRNIRIAQEPIFAALGLDRGGMAALAGPFLPPYGGKFHSGGVVPGPLGAERTIIAKGGETVSTGAPNIEVNVHPHPDGTAWVEVAVDGVLQKHSQSAGVGRQFPSAAGVNA